MWHIVRREILDNLSRFRFSITLVMVIGLMVVNAVLFVTSKYPRRIAEYSQDVNAAMASMKYRARSLSRLAVSGPGNLYKSPSPLAFIATGEDEALPKHISANATSNASFSTPNFFYAYTNNWGLQYPQDVPRRNDSLPNFMELDWVFIIGMVMSFVAIVFTYDGISGEREIGTLMLLISNPVSRVTVLLAKFIAAFVSVMVPLVVGILLNLMIITTSRLVLFEGSEWTRIGISIVVSIVYVSIFLWMGLFISSQFSNSSSSLLILLLVWIVFVVLIPNTIGGLTAGIHPIGSIGDISKLKATQLGEIDVNYRKEGKLFRFGSPSENPPKIVALRTWADYLNQRSAIEDRINGEHLDNQIAQVAYVRRIVRISPAAVYKYTLESLSDTGFAKHKRFIQQVRRYKIQFLDFIKSEDSADPTSHHVYFVKEGLSQKSVPFNSVPKFSEQLTLGITFNETLLDLALLFLFVLLLFTAASLSFLWRDIT